MSFSTARLEGRALEHGFVKVLGRRRVRAIRMLDSKGRPVLVENQAILDKMEEVALVVWTQVLGTTPGYADQWIQSRSTSSSDQRKV